MALPDGGTQTAYNAGRTVIDPWAPFYDPYGVDANHPAVAYAKALIAENANLPPGDQWTPSEAIDTAAQLYKIGPYTPEPRQGPGPVAFSSTRQAAQEAMAFEREQTAASQKFQAEQAAIDRQTQERMNRLRDLNDLIKEAMANQQSAKEMKFAYRNDEFALAGAFSAQGPRGVSPVQAARGELTNYINQPIPTVAPNATLPQINQAITQVPGQVPISGGYGMAAGGSMGPQGPDFSPPGYSVIVGEGALNGDEEVVTRLNDGTVLVTPLKGGAATGATLPATPTAPSSYPAIEDLYRRFGFSNIPTYHTSTELNTRSTPGGFALRGVYPGQLSSMGYAPNLIRNPATGAIYYNEGGVLRPFSTAGFEKAGFDYRNVLNPSQKQFDAYKIATGSNVNRLPDIGPETGNYGSLTTPMFTSFGQLLPNPSYVSAELLDAYNFDPIAWSNYMSAYGSAVGPTGEPMGMSEEQLLARARAPLPTGVPTQVLGYR